MIESSLVPLWFYGLATVTYMFVSVVCFLIAFLALRSYRIISSTSYIHLFFSFLILGFAFLALLVPSALTYLYRGLVPSGMNRVNYLGFMTYYTLSLFSYIILTLLYLPRKKRELPLIFVPLWYADSTRFHVSSIIMILYVFLRSLLNSLKKRNRDSYLVSYSFLSLLIFHLLLLLVPFNVRIYVTANVFLLTGFLSLLYMLLRVRKT